MMDRLLTTHHLDLTAHRNRKNPVVHMAQVLRMEDPTKHWARMVRLPNITLRSTARKRSLETRKRVLVRKHIRPLLLAAMERLNKRRDIVETVELVVQAQLSDSVGLLDPVEKAESAELVEKAESAEHVEKVEVGEVGEPEESEESEESVVLAQRDMEGRQRLVQQDTLDQITILNGTVLPYTLRVDQVAIRPTPNMEMIMKRPASLEIAHLD